MVKLSAVAPTVKVTGIEICELPVVAVTLTLAPEAGAIFAAVVMVSCTVCADVLLIATLEGLKLQDAPAGRPSVQPPAGETPELKLTVPMKLFIGVMVIVEVDDCPAETVRVVGLAVNENGTVTVMGAVFAVEPLADESPS
jgi:hypothetical protein